MGVVKEDENQKWVESQFKAWLKKETPKAVGAYEFQPEHVLVDMFVLEPPKKSSLILPNATEVERGFMWTPVARVVATADPGYEIGDIVKLSDYKVAVFKNPDYEQYNSLSTKGNIVKNGQTPPPYMSRFHESYMRYKFNASPITENEQGMRLYLVPKFEIIAKIKKPNDIIF
jgi:hypothetical protein